MMWVYKVMLVFLVAVFLRIVYRDAKKWDWVMIGMILVPMVLRVLGVK
ncbi:MAG TPA: hypothetical protein P5560_06635 [Thermotogota bacterium]|nr:hypothetical protein [Thermotogota bacterium]HRW92606.1 hypothetical protein [Thermotogota bacterium]